MRGLITILLSLSIAVFPLPGNADEGATDADGCHGEPSLHCHHPEPEEEEEDWNEDDVQRQLQMERAERRAQKERQQQERADSQAHFDDRLSKVLELDEWTQQQEEDELL